MSKHLVVRLTNALAHLPAKVSTHTDGKAYDRILVSDAIANGRTKLKLDRVEIYPHRHGRGEPKRIRHLPHRVQDHPHACGENASAPHTISTRVGPSPRMWGEH